MQNITEITMLALALNRDSPAALDGLASCVLLQVETFPMDQPCLFWALLCPGCCSAVSGNSDISSSRIASEELTVSFAKPSA